MSITRNCESIDGGGCVLAAGRERSALPAFWIGVVLLMAGGCQGQPAGEELTDSRAPATSRSAAAMPPPVDLEPEQPSLVDNPDRTFELVEMPPGRTGVSFRHVSGDSPEKPFPAANGSGVGVIDYDLDGWSDLYFATGADFPLDMTPESPANAAFRNLGDWHFVDVSRATRLDVRGYSSGIALGDVDADGFGDIYITCFGENQLLRNCGDGTFAAVRIASGGNFSTSAAFLDADGDGLLDLYVGNYGEWSYENNPFCGDRERNVRIFCSPRSLDPEPDRFLTSQGDGTFRDATTFAGLDVAVGRAQGVLATDVDGDGHIDLYLGNDIHPNFLFMNDGGGHFQDMTELTGAAYDRSGQMQAGMGLAGGDVNRDGLWDLFVTNFENEHHTLYLQFAPRAFDDVSMVSGLSAASRPWVGWGTALIDLDLDGWKDLILTDGHVDNNLAELGRDSPYEQPALVWKNIDGRMEFLGPAAGAYFEESHPGRGLATADFDEDGDWDVVISHQDQPPALLRNDRDHRSPRSSLTVRLIGTRSNRDAIGSRIVLQADGKPHVEQIQGGGSYLSAHDLRVIVPVDDDGAVDLVVTWPSGEESEIEGLKPSQHYDIVEPSQAGSSALVFSRPYPSAPPKRSDDD